MVLATFWDDTSFVAIELPFPPVLQRAWAIRQLAVGDAIRRKIRQHRHGFSYARSATMTGENSDNCFLEPMEAVAHMNQKTLRAQTKLDTTMCPEGMSGSRRSRARCPSLCHRSTNWLEKKERKRQQDKERRRGKKNRKKGEQMHFWAQPVLTQVVVDIHLPRPLESRRNLVWIKRRFDVVVCPECLTTFPHVENMATSFFFF